MFRKWLAALLRRFANLLDPIPVDRLPAARVTSTESRSVPSVPRFKVIRQGQVVFTGDDGAEARKIFFDQLAGSVYLYDGEQQRGAR